VHPLADGDDSLAQLGVRAPRISGDDEPQYGLMREIDHSRRERLAEKQENRGRGADHAEHSSAARLNAR